MDQGSIKTTALQGVFEIQRQTFSDDRGFFREVFRLSELESEIKHPFRIAQANHARSPKNTLRGIHAAPWNKLIYATRGKIQAVIVDLRENSENFGKYESFIIGDENRSSIYIPHGFGNSYVVLNDEADYTYLTDQEWAPNMEKSVVWNDPDLNIKWEFEGEPVLSERDQKNQTLRLLFPEKF